jgi:apolipoprotein N-acyltransferase
MAFAIDARRIGFAVLAVIATAVLVWFGTGLSPLWPLLWFAPMPVLLFASRSRWWTAGLTAALAWAAGSLNMWHYFATALHVPLVGCMQIVAGTALFFALAVLLYRALLRRGAYWSALLAFPAVWVSFEYIFNLTSPHGTAISLAYSQLSFLPVLQLASITGPWGISFLLLVFSSALAIGIHLRAIAPKQAVRIVGTMLGVLALVLSFGAVRLALHPPPGQDVRVGLIASDLPANAGVAAAGAPAEHLFNDYATAAASLATQGSQVIVIPENLGVVVDPNTGPADTIFQSLADKTHVTIVVGVGHVEAGAKFNEARVYTPGAPVQLYAKHHLLPPFESKFTPGKTRLTLDEPNGVWGVAICKDFDFTQLSRQYGQAGAGLMLAPAWDFVLDRVSHGHIAIMRGVESGFALARAARGGSLLVTDNRGRILAETESNSAPFATLIADVPAVHDNTLYLLLGDWFAWVVLAILFWTLVQLMRLRIRGRSDSFLLPVVRATRPA